VHRTPSDSQMILNINFHSCSLWKCEDEKVRTRTSQWIVFCWYKCHNKKKVCAFTRDVKGNWAEPDWVECPEWSLKCKSFQWRCATACNTRACNTRHHVERVQSIHWNDEYVCVCWFLRSQKYFARCRDNTSTTRAIPSANNQRKFALLTQLSNTHAHTVGTNDNGCRDARFWVQTTQLLPLELVPAAGTADTESELKYRLLPRYPSPFLSPLQLESSRLFPSSCSMVFRIFDVALPLSYHATWTAHFRTRFAWVLVWIARYYATVTSAGDLTSHCWFSILSLFLSSCVRLWQSPALSHARLHHLHLDPKRTLWRRCAGWDLSINVDTWKVVCWVDEFN
jgi:hypothetical protein